MLDWHIAPFKADRWLDVWESAAARMPAFGAKSWSLTRSIDDPLSFQQTSVWESRTDFERWVVLRGDRGRLAPRSSTTTTCRSCPPGTRSSRPNSGGAQPRSSGARVRPAASTAPSSARPAHAGPTRRSPGRCCGSVGDLVAAGNRDARNDASERLGHVIEGVVVVVADDHPPRAAKAGVGPRLPGASRSSPASPHYGRAGVKAIGRRAESRLTPRREPAGSPQRATWASRRPATGRTTERLGRPQWEPKC